MDTHVQGMEFYNEAYARANFFGYRSWVYEPYIASLIRYCRLRKGDSLLDVGCGQGFFSWLFSRNGIEVHGIDPSEAGIKAAQKLYGNDRVRFSIGDVKTIESTGKFDCVFVRSCSLYNNAGFAWDTSVTRDFLECVKPGGVFIFIYNTNLSLRPNSKWRFHSLQEAKQHFSGYPDARVFFINKLTPYVLRRFSFNPLSTKLNALLSRASGSGGDLVCIVRKPQADAGQTPEKAQ
jgi:SAM-dependent methyltransferase